MSLIEKGIVVEVVAPEHTVYKALNGKRGRVKNASEQVSNVEFGPNDEFCVPNEYLKRV